MHNFCWRLCHISPVKYDDNLADFASAGVGKAGLFPALAGPLGCAVGLLRVEGVVPAGPRLPWGSWAGPPSSSWLKPTEIIG